MKRITVILVALLACVSATQAQNFVGADFGTLISKGAHPALGYAVTQQYSIEPLGGQIFKTMSVSALYSDFDVQPVQEVYAVRTFIGRDFQYMSVYAGIGAGGWMFVNSEGGDFASTAAQLKFGLRVKGFDFHLGGDVVSHEGPDIFFPHCGIVIGL